MLFVLYLLCLFCIKIVKLNMFLLMDRQTPDYTQNYLNIIKRHTYLNSYLCINEYAKVLFVSNQKVKKRL